jgi:hypothetical protein
MIVKVLALIQTSSTDSSDSSSSQTRLWPAFAHGKGLFPTGRLRPKMQPNGHLIDQLLFLFLSLLVDLLVKKIPPNWDGRQWILQGGIETDKIVFPSRLHF